MSKGSGEIIELIGRDVLRPINASEEVCDKREVRPSAILVLNDIISRSRCEGFAAS